MLLHRHLERGAAALAQASKPIAHRRVLRRLGDFQRRVPVLCAKLGARARDEHALVRRGGDEHHATPRLRSGLASVQLAERIDHGHDDDGSGRGHVHGRYFARRGALFIDSPKRDVGESSDGLPRHASQHLHPSSFREEGLMTLQTSSSATVQNT